MDSRSNKPLFGKITKSPNFKSFMKTLALMGGSLTLVGIVLKLAGDHGGAPLLMTGMGTLAIVSYFLGALFPYKAKEGEETDNNLAAMWNFVATLTGYALSITIVGLLFSICHWPGGTLILCVGGAILAIGGVAWIIINAKKNKRNQ